MKEKIIAFTFVIALLSIPSSWAAEKARDNKNNQAGAAPVKFDLAKNKIEDDSRMPEAFKAKLLELQEKQRVAALKSHEEKRKALEDQIKRIENDARIPADKKIAPLKGMRQELEKLTQEQQAAKLSSGNQPNVNSRPVLADKK